MEGCLCSDFVILLFSSTACVCARSKIFPAVPLCCTLYPPTFSFRTLEGQKVLTGWVPSKCSLCLNSVLYVLAYNQSTMASTSVTTIPPQSSCWFSRFRKEDRAVISAALSMSRPSMDVHDSLDGSLNLFQLEPSSRNL